MVQILLFRVFILQHANLYWRGRLDRYSVRCVMLETHHMTVVLKDARIIELLLNVCIKVST